MTKELGSPARPRGFVLRLVVDEQGSLHGQLSEPASGDEWRTTFATAEELWAVLRQRFEAGAIAANPPARPNAEEAFAQ